MKLMVWLLAFFGYIISVHCFLKPLIAHPGGIGGIFKGPNSETIIKGPDGSVITSESEGGEVHTDTGLEPIVAADTIETDGSADLLSNAITPTVTTGTLAALQYDGSIPIQTGGSLSVTLAPPIEPVLSGTATPQVTSLPSVITANQPVGNIQGNTHIIETEVVDAPINEPEQSSDLIGPSGRISTRGSSSIVSGPASTTISEPAKILVAPAIPVASITIPLQAPPIVQVNQDAPLALSNPLNLIAETVIHPELSSVTVSPINAVSTTASFLGVSRIIPPSESRNLDTNWVPISTPSSILRSSPISDVDDVVSHSIASPIHRNGVWSSTISPLDVTDGNNNIVQLASSNGIITDVGEATLPTTTRPVLPFTDTSNEGEMNLRRFLDQTLIENRQLTLNPNNIPPRNVVPPEIGLSAREPLNLEPIEADSSVPRAPGLASLDDSRNVQKDRYNIDRSRERIPDQPVIFSRVDSIQNEVIPVDPRYQQSLEVNTPLLRDTQPNAYRIVSQRDLGNGNIQLSNIAVSSIENVSSNIPVSREEFYDDKGTEILWNRYGRRARFGRQ